MLSPVKHLNLPHLSQRRHCLLTLSQEHQEHHSATVFYPVYQKLSRPPTCEQKSLETDTNSATTPKFGNRKFSALVISCMPIAHSCCHLPHLKWTWKNTPNYFHTLLDHSTHLNDVSNPRNWSRPNETWLLRNMHCLNLTVCTLKAEWSMTTNNLHLKEPRTGTLQKVMISLSKELSKKSATGI